MSKCPSCGCGIDGDSVRCTCGYDLSGFTKSELIPVQPSDTPWNRVTLSTAPFIEGFQVVDTLEIVTAESAFGMNMFKDLLTSMTDLFGGRSGVVQNTLRDARKVCLDDLKKEAHSLGANAVIAVDLDYSEFSGQGKSMLFMVASGTAVKVIRKETAK